MCTTRGPNSWYLHNFWIRVQYVVVFLHASEGTVQQRGCYGLWFDSRCSYRTPRVVLLFLQSHHMAIDAIEQYDIYMCENGGNVLVWRFHQNTPVCLLFPSRIFCLNLCGIYTYILELILRSMVAETPFFVGSSINGGSWKLCYTLAVPYSGRVDCHFA